MFKWRNWAYPLFFGGLATTILVGLHFAPKTKSVPAPVALHSTGVTRDLRDLDFVGGVEIPKTAHGFAPLIGWENSDIRERKPIQFCVMPDVDEQIFQNFKVTLSTVSGWYEGINLTAQRGKNCNGKPYTVTTGAQADCGDGALACAAYLGPRSMRLSYHPGWGSDKAYRAGLGHELGHMFNLNHTALPDCGGGGLVSAMSPIYTPDGPAVCGGTDAVIEDYGLAETYYGLVRRQAVPNPVNQNVHIRVILWTQTNGQWQTSVPFDGTASAPVGQVWLQFEGSDQFFSVPTGAGQ